MVLGSRQYQPAAGNDLVCAALAEYLVAPVRFQLDRRRRARLCLSREFHLRAVVGPGKISLCAYRQGRYEQSYGTQEEGPRWIAKSLRIDSHHQLLLQTDA